MIENLVPNTYYLKEIKAIDGYEIYDQLIKVDIDLNQEITVEVSNKKEEVAKIENIQKISREVKKLPVTGM